MTSFRSPSEYGDEYDHGGNHDGLDGLHAHDGLDGIDGLKSERDDKDGNFSGHHQNLGEVSQTVTHFAQGSQIDQNCLRCKHQYFTILYCIAYITYVIYIQKMNCIFM